MALFLSEFYDVLFLLKDGWVPWDCPETQMKNDNSFCDESHFWFSAGLGFVDWQEVIDDTLPFQTNVNETDSLIGRAARYNVNPMIVLAHIIIEPEAYGIGDLTRVKVDDNLLTKVEEKPSSGNLDIDLFVYFQG